MLKPYNAIQNKTQSCSTQWLTSAKHHTHHFIGANKQTGAVWQLHTEHIRQPACPCWKALSLFLKREGRTKSQPRASSASSFLTSGSCRKEISFILMLLPANGASVMDGTQPRVRIISFRDDTPLSVCIKAPVSGSCSPQPCSSLSRSPACCSMHPILAGRGHSVLSWKVTREIGRGCLCERARGGGMWRSEGVWICPFQCAFHSSHRDYVKTQTVRYRR